MVDWRSRMVGLDLETTGLDPLNDRVVAAAVVSVDSAKGVVFQREWLTDPGIPIPEAATRVHGITTEKAQAEGGDYSDTLQGIYSTVSAQVADGTPLVVFNAPYDLTILQSEGKRLGLSTDYSQFPVVDPLVLDRMGDKYRKGRRTLTSLTEHYQVEQGEAHSALGDVMSMLRVVWKIGELLPSPTLPYCKTPLENLQRQQEVGYREWKKGLISFLKKQGRMITDGNLTWPLQEV